MSIRPETSRAAGAALVLGLALTGLAAPTPAAAQDVPAELRSGGHLEVLSGYLRAGDERAVVRGMVRRQSLWRGPVDGHLHVVAYGAQGEVIADRPTRWRSPFDSHGGAQSYQADLEVRRADVARLSVSWAPGSHRASETYP